MTQPVRLAADEVLGWSADWVYVPAGAPTVETDDYLLIAHPPTWADPNAAFRIDSGRAPEALVDEIVEAATGLGLDAVTLWVHDGTRPPGLADAVLARGGVLLEELAVLARPLDGGFDPGADLAVPADVEVRASTDLATERDFDRVGYTVFGGGPADDASLQADLDRRDAAAGAAVVAYLDGEAVGAAGLTVAGDVARLWGGSVVEQARGRGVYRALLAHRLAHGRDLDCRAALVKGRLTTSAPTLRRAGFAQYGEERGYRLTWT